MAKLRFAVRKFEPFERVLATLWEEFNKESGSAHDMEFVPMDLEELHASLFDRQGLKGGDFDIVHLNTDWLTRAYAEGGLLTLNDHLTEPFSPPEQVWSEALCRFQDFDGNIVGLPFHDGPECLVVRKDLFDDEGEKVRYRARTGRELSIPKTWDEFLSVASFFTRPEDNLYGTVFAGYPDGHNAVFDFCLQLWSRGGELQDKDGQLSIDHAVAVEALDFYRSLFQEKKCLHPQSKVYESVAAGQAFSRGEVAMMVNWFGFASWAHIDGASAVRGKVDVFPVPSLSGDAPCSLNVYWLYGIPAGSRSKSLAMDFVRFAVSPQSDKALTLGGGVGCRLSTWQDREVNDMIPFYHKLEELHQISRTFPRFEQWSEIAHVLDEAVGQSITTDRSSEELLKEAQNKINRLSC